MARDTRREYEQRNAKARDKGWESYSALRKAKETKGKEVEMVPGKGTNSSTALVPTPHKVIDVHATEFNRNHPSSTSLGGFAGKPYGKEGIWEENAGANTGKTPEDMLHEHLTRNYHPGDESLLPARYGGGSGGPGDTHPYGTYGDGGEGYRVHHMEGPSRGRRAIQAASDAWQRSRVFAGPNGLGQAVRYTAGISPMASRTRQMYRASALENLNGSRQFEGLGAEEI